MACTNPNLIKFVVDPDTGSVHSVFVGSARFTDPHDYGKPYVDSTWYQTVPCGKCASCRCDYSREWSNRMILELADHDKAIFLTLTYNNENLPISDMGFPTLSKRDIQLFLKRLRKKFPDHKIRFYLAGEYGSKTHRPHYHAIIYGIGIDSFSDTYFRGNNEIGQPFYSSQILESIWSKGFVLFSEVTWRTCNYVARYVLKKQQQVEDSDGVCCLPFNLSSRKPGIGMSHASALLDSGDTVFSIDGKDGIHDIPIPRSIIKRLKELDVDKYNEICYTRGEISRDKLILDLDASGLPYFEFLRRRDEDLKRKLRILPERK